MTMGGPFQIVSSLFGQDPIYYWKQHRGKNNDTNTDNNDNALQT